MKAVAALFGALLCILLAGTLTTAKAIESSDKSRTNSQTEGTTTVATVTSVTRQPTTHLTETPLVTTSKTETPVKTTATAASTTVSSTHRQTTSETSPQTITHLTTEWTTTTAKPTTTTTKASTTTTTAKPTTTTKVPTTTTAKPTTTTKVPTTTTTTTPNPTTTTTTPTTTVSSTTVTPNVVTNHHGNPTTEQTGGSEFPVWPQTTASPSTSQSTTMSPTSTLKPTTSNPSTSSPSTHATVSTSTSTSTNNPSTTTARTSTTTYPSTPTLPPNPSPPSKWWHVVYDSNGTNCMMIRFAAQIDVTYVTVDNRTVKTGFDIPGNASVNEALSTCDKASLSEVFALNFASHSVADGYLVAIFKKNAKTNDSSLFELMVSYPITRELFPDISPKYHDKVILLTSTNLTQFEVDPLHCYTCSSRLSLNFTSIEVKDVHDDDELPSPSSEPTEHIFKQSAFVTRDLKIQTFLPSKKNMDIFMPGKLCNGDKADTLWTVDFIVAVVLAGLVTLTLIIYYGVKKYKARNASSPEDTLPIVEE